MGNRRHRIILISLIFTASLISYSNANTCSVIGTSPPIPTHAWILDTHEGIFWQNATANVARIYDTVHDVNTGNRQYVSTDIVDTAFVLATTELFKEYEVHETSTLTLINVRFECTVGTVTNPPLTVWINVIDTNNHWPEFNLPPNADGYVFTVFTPVPPGFEITGCVNDITVTDIDLTTQRIDFEIEENPYFEIDYDAEASTQPKQFKAMLRTKAFIRSIPEPIQLKISATDVDLTDDPRKTTTTTVTIVANADFAFPEEPVFSQTFYLADYTNDNRVVLTEPITLQTGYDEHVRFDIGEDWSDNFEVEPDPDHEDQLLIRVILPLEGDVLFENNIHLIVRAHREHTSGASATIVLRLPEVVPLEFESSHYGGTVEKDNLDAPTLILSQGYEGETVTATVGEEHSSYFTANVQGNRVTLLMGSLDENIINENSFLNIEVSATTGRSIATTIVTLEIIKDDSITPVFDGTVYRGTYSNPGGLTHDHIVLVQGYDGIEEVALLGDYSNLFIPKLNDDIMTIEAPETIPPELYSKESIVLTLEVRKPRTVGASAAVIITLPAARELEFGASTYRGSLQDGVLNLDPIPLTVGYDSSVLFTISGDHESHFRVTNDQNPAVITLNSEEPIPSGVISENNIIFLTLTASGLNAVTTTTSILLDIIKEDTTTPVFSRNIYHGTYDGTLDLNIIGDIRLTQGFDSSVTFSLDGDHAQYFDIDTSDLNNVVVFPRPSIPEEVIFMEKVLVFNVLALKPLTVGASAAIAITFPTELTDQVVMRFTQNTYTGTIDSSGLSLDDIVLSSGYTPGTEFALTGDYVTHFELPPSDNGVVSLKLNVALPIDTIEKAFIVLEIEAKRERAVSVWTSVVIEIIRKEIVPPVFLQPYYNGVYNEDKGLEFNEVISLLYGFDETVSFTLDGEFSTLFHLVPNGINSESIDVLRPIPNDILQANSHLLFTVVASKPGALAARSAISIDIDKENAQGAQLGFDRVTYLGSIENNVADIGPITVIEGYTDDVVFGLYGDLADYFIPNRVGAVVNVGIREPIPEALIPANRIITLTIRASAPTANTAHATIVFHVVVEDDTSPTVQLAFDAAYYTGTYNANDDLDMHTTIALLDGHDDTVEFNLHGEQSLWFGVEPLPNSVRVVMTDAIPAAVLQNNNHLVFTISAEKTGAATVQATIVISLTDDENAQGAQLGFDRVTYLGSIENNVADIGPITVIEGYTADVVFGLYGDLADYFIPNRVGAVVNVGIREPIPEALIPANRIITLTIRASAPTANTAHATIVFHVVVEDDTSPTVQLAFDAAYYTGTYNANDDLDMHTTIALLDGHDDTVEFNLHGEQSLWFGVEPLPNSVRVVMTDAIPAAVLQNNNHLVFTISAEKTGAATAQATIVISLTDDENAQGAQLGFDRVTYLGSIENNVADIGPITVIEGYTDDVVFGLYGDLADYFIPNRVGAVVNVGIREPIPEALIPANRIITLTIRASAPTANTAHATIVFHVVVEDDTSPTVQLAFDAAYYTGTYNANDDLDMHTTIALLDGHDDTVEFNLHGEQSLWFGVEPLPNSVRVVMTDAIPAAVLQNNNHLVFTISAEKTGAATAQATIVISLTDDENAQGAQLGFDRVTYLGSIENNVADIGPITVIEGYTDDVVFGLYGDLADYFIPNRVGAVVNVGIREPIPEALIPANRIITLTIRVSAPTANTAHATIVFHVVVEDDTSPTVQLAFDAAYYTGTYNANDDLDMHTTIALLDGHDDTVEFNLHGEQSLWFGVEPLPNSVRVVMTDAIPAAVLQNNNHLVFTISAEKTGAATAQATIVISLTDDENAQGAQLGFDRVTYLGSIENNVADIGPITVIEGYTADVVFGLYGDLADYFIPNRVGAVVNVGIREPIPEALIPANRIITLTIRASAPTANTAHATIVFHVVVEDDTSPTVQLAFDAAYYTGTYNANDDLDMHTTIALLDGHDDTVEFNLHGEQSLWFGVEPLPNSVRVVMTDAIPAAVLQNNNHLVFTISAEKTGAATAQATIVISLTDDENSQGAQLGFDRVTYLGSIENNVADIGPITVIEGYTDDVVFGLYGDLADYFIPNRVGAVVNVGIREPIPEALIPANRIITLTIRASAPTANTAHATIVFHVVVEDDTSPTVQLAFDAAYYTGTYNANDDLDMHTTIALLDGHDDTVEFNLHGEQSLWFGVEPLPNSVRVVMTDAIPAAVLQNNNHLVFTISAEKTGAATAQATIVISLTDDENAQGAQLGFDRVTYLGSIENNVADIGPITVIEGYTDDVVFGLYGDLADYFIPNRVGAVVNVGIREPIPEALIPANRIITLTIRASAPTANTAHATIVFHVVVEDDTSPTVQLAFDAAYYTGTYNANDDLDMHTTIALLDGHDDTVEFNLHGEQSLWFGVEPLPNSVRVVMTDAIPAAVLQNNNHLVFTISAEKTGAATAQATIVISLTDDENAQGAQLGFDRVTYLGSIENNVADIGPITVIEGYTDDVVFGLYGDLADYFIPNRVGAVVNVGIREPIPEALIPANRIITLTIRVSAPTANTAHATIVFHVVVEDDTSPTVQLAFDAAYYTGTYNANDDLDMHTTIALLDGHDDTVEFNLHGEQSLWFGVEPLPNSVRVVMTDAIPAAVLQNNNHLVFTISAEKTGAATAQATIVISLTDDENAQGAQLGFDRVTYLGSIENNVADIGPITVIEGYTADVVFGLYGDLADYFIPNRVGAVVNVGIREPIPEALIPANRIITLTIRASAPTANTAHATIVFHVVVEDDTSPTVQLAFDAAYYTGTYNANDDLDMHTTIALLDGHDDTVEFNLHGEQSLWFGVEPLPNSVRVVMTDAIPAAVLQNNNHLVFTISAEKTGAATAQATIVISLTDDENAQGAQLGFDRVTYLGSIENNVADIGPITVIEGYTADVVFGLYGDLADYFIPNRVGAVVNVGIREPIPEALIPANRIITLTIRASAPTANTAHATIVFHVVVEDDTSPTVQLAFDAAYYTGTYNANDDLDMHTTIALLDGHDDTVEFNLHGEQSLWFGVEPLPNSVRVVMTDAIPAAVLQNNNHLVFTISAEKTGAATAQATIVISLTDDENAQGAQLGFDRVTYLGSIENNVADIGPITVIEGYTDDVVFGLYGDLADYFIPNRVGAVVNVGIREPIPEALIPANRIITLTIRASAPTANTAHATIVFHVVVEDDTSPTVQLAFDAAYYTGTYNANDDLDMHTTIALLDGHDDTVEFNLHGEQSLWFGVEPLPNSVRVVMTDAIPAAVLQNNNHLVFTISAEKTGAATAQATIVISLTDDENAQGAQLGFDRVTYLGSIENNVADIGPITVIEGYTDDVVFGLYGDLADYFIPNRVGAVVNVGIREPIPEALIPANRIITLTIRASAPTANTAHATIVFHVVVEDDTSPTVQLAFDAAYYTGTYNANDDLDMHTTIALLDGHDDTVEFNLHGEQSLWFGVEPLPNSVRVVMTDAIPAAVLQNNNHLVFTISAEKTGAATAQATIVISLTDDENAQGAQLGFDRVTYLGSIENNVADIGPITVIEGYTDDVVFGLYGDLADYFIPNRVGAVVNVGIREPIPEALIPANRIITLTIRASAPTANTAHATIVFHVVVEDDTSPTVQLAFDAAYYTGTYNANDDLDMHTTIALLDGHDDTVEFNLHGEQSLWFGVEPLPNSVRVVMTDAIPAAVLQNNNHLVFTISAEKTGAATAQATIVISLTDDENAQGAQLGFDRVTYLGSIENNVADIGPITVIEGYTDDVVFGLYGDLADYFIPNRVGAVVNVGIREPIPEALIPANRIITLTIRASAPTANTAHATIVFHVVVEDDTSPTVQLAFDAAYYTGTYNANDDLDMHTTIALLDGHDDTVEFNLHGEQSLWFGVEPLPNSVRVVMTDAIPAAVLQNNNHLVFTISAEKTGAATAQATIVISLTDDENAQGAQLGFDRVTYLGSIENNVADIGPITVIEGYTADVVFGLYGDLADYFIPNRVGAVVNVGIREPIPEALIPANRIITLTIRASAPTANTAHATIVFHVVVEDDTSPTVQLAFDAAYYTGTYNANDDLDMHTTIALLDGHDDTVEFNLHGEQSLWFGVEPLPNSVRVVMTDAIPAAVLQNNNHLVFTISAEKTGAATAQATIVISLTDDENAQGAQLGFDRVTYLGSIENNVADIGPITVIEGYTDDVVFGLYGDLADYFIPNRVGAVVNVGIREPIPEALIPANRIITLTIRASAPTANTAHATIVFHVVVEDDTSPTVQLAFDAAYYTGTYNANDDLDMHTTIALLDGHDDTVEFNLHGEQSLWFGVEPLPNSVRVVMTDAIPAAVLQNNNHLVFTISAEKTGAATAQATIVISLTHGPSVTFSSNSYVLTVGETQTGFVGRVSATADNGEAVTYLLGTDDAHLQTRLSINNEGELYLSAPANSGVYTIEVIATTVTSQATATAPVHLRVEAVTECGDNSIVTHPLITLDRDEEAAHNNLVVLDPTQHAGCHFTMTNRWPTDQTWLYVDENGLHTIAIDREHPSIAFMALSQVQVELVLHCESDSAVRQKRSDRTERLGPYDYGGNNWILTDTITYDSRRSLVNLIVNDINDNNPIFVGKEHEPIAVGYPTDELEERILPRSLAELKATDADIGENAALRYWSSESVLAVAPTTGFVHVRSGARLTHDQLLTVTATDRAGQGLSGTIQLVVKLLDVNHIAVLTIRDAFLDDETTVLAQLSEAVGYELRTLRSVVISDDIDGDVTRNKRETTSTSASLQLYVYGINDREPVAVDRLAADISSNSAMAGVVSTIPLEDHLENISDNQIGLLVSTIVLGVLLFAVILLIAIWFFFRWRKNRNYDEFNEENSLSSRNASLGELPKPEVVQPRLNIEDLKKSERRLQEMLHAPIEEVTVDPMPRNMETPVEAILDLPIHEPSTSIVIQSIDKLKDADDSSDDEFGEVSVKPRKSVVTFNENVEKIIHVEDNIDDGDGDGDVDINVNNNVDALNTGYEIYRL